MTFTSPYVLSVEFSYQSSPPNHLPYAKVAYQHLVTMNEYLQNIMV